MSKSQHVLKIQKNGTTYSCEMYITPQEARDNLYAGKYISFEKDGQDLYVPLTQVLDSPTESTQVLVNKKNDPNRYCIAQKSFYKATATPVANAVLTVNAYDGNNVLLDTWSSGSKWFPYGTKITASVVGNPNNIWQTPALRIDSGDNVNNVMTVNNIDVSADAPTRKSYSFTLNPGSNQTVTLKYTQPGSSQVSVAVSGSTRTFTVLAGTTWSASITAVTTGYNAGRLNISSGTITGSGVAITATSATRKTYTLKLNGTSNQTITLRYTQPGSSQVTRTSTGSAQSWSVAYGTTWTASIAASSGYTAGTLSGTSGTITGDVTVSATAAKAIPVVVTRTLTFTTNKRSWINGYITYTNASGSVVTATYNQDTGNTFTLKNGTTFKFQRMYAENLAHCKVTTGGTVVVAYLEPGQTFTSATITANTTYDFYMWMEYD